MMTYFVRILTRVVLMSCLVVSVNINSLTSSTNAMVISPILEVQNNQLNSESALSVSATTIFLAGIIVGYVVDGVVIWSTGHSAAEWTSIGLTHLSNYINYLGNVTQFRFSNRGEKFNYALNSSGCVWTGPYIGGVWNCPLRDIIE